MRRILLILLVLAIIAAAGWTLIDWNKERTVIVDPWRAVPLRSAVIVELPDAFAFWDRATHRSQLWTSLQGLPAFVSTSAVIDRIAAGMEEDPALRGALTGTEVIISVVRSAGQSAGMLLVCRPGPGDPSAVTRFAQIMGAGTENTTTLQGMQVLQLHPDTAFDPLSFTTTEGLWLLATSPELLEEALIQMRSGKAIGTDSLLTRIRTTLDNGTDGHVLVHLERTRNLLDNWWRTEALKDLETPDGWVGLDLDLGTDALILSGLALPGKAGTFWGTLEEQGKGDAGLLRAVPADVDRLDGRRMTDTRAYLALHGTTVADSVFDGLLGWIHGSITLARAPADSGRTALWALFDTGDPTDAQEALERMNMRGARPDTFSYRGNRLTRLPQAGPYERLFGPAFADLERPWWTLLGERIVMAATPALLARAVDAWTDGNSLAEDPRASAWSERMSTQVGRLWWTDLARAWPALAGGLKAPEQEEFRARRDVWERIGGITVQLAPGQHGFQHVTIGVQHAPLSAPVDGARWRAPIGADVLRAPDIVLNHVNRTREVFVQDVRNRVSLVSATGNMLWQRGLEGAILGTVQQIDRFRNGKLQLLFNTADNVYLIDRNGKDVAGFPVKLKQRATAALTAVDYEGDRDHRILLPTSDGRILNLGVDGLPVKGWGPKALTNASVNAVRYLRIRNKDHLLVVDGDGRVHVLDRRGEVREQVKGGIPAGALVRALNAGQDLATTELIWQEAAGNAGRMGLDGEGHPIAAADTGWVRLGPLRADGTLDIAVLRNDSVIVRNSGKTWLQRAFPPASGPLLDWTAPDRDDGPVAVALPATGQVYVFDRSGRPYAGMPVSGTLPGRIADLDLDGVQELITITKDGSLVAHRLGPLPGPPN